MLAGLEPAESRDPALAAHLDTCDRCRAAAAQAETLWADALASADAEADAAFTSAVLDRQQATILRRLEQQGHPARLLRFPVSPSLRSGAHQVARRWVAAAAAAGLLVGIAAGRFLPLQRGASDRRPASTTARLAPPSPAVGSPVRTPERRHDTDEAFLVDLEMAAASPRIEPLQVLDAMTPRTTDGRR